MAGTGPAPDPNSRRSKQTGKFKTLDPGNPDRGIPRLPTRGAGLGWLKATREAWTAWWRSPMANEWDEQSDMGSLILMATAYDDTLRGNAKANAEYRQWADRFGLSPMGRQRNGWQLPDDVKVEADGPAHGVRQLRAVG